MEKNFNLTFSRRTKQTAGNLTNVKQNILIVLSAWFSIAVLTILI